MPSSIASPGCTMPEAKHQALITKLRSDKRFAGCLPQRRRGEQLPLLTELRSVHYRVCYRLNVSLLDGGDGTEIEALSAASKLLEQAYNVLAPGINGHLISQSAGLMA